MIINRLQSSLIVLLLLVSGQTPPALTLPTLDATRIWDAASHCAFTDIAHWQGRFYITCRESNAHVYGTDGKIRVIVSDDGVAWQSFALIQEDGVDLRDPKLSTTPDGRLMLLFGGSYYHGRTLQRRQPRVAFLSPGEETFTDPVPIVVDESITTHVDWLWRVTWHQGTAYGVIYQHLGDRVGLYLVKSDDGIHYDALHSFDITGRPNETTVRFNAAGEMLLFIRRGSEDRQGFIARAAPPFTDWQVEPMGERVGGPNMILLDDDTTLMAFRRYTNPKTTVLGVLGEDGQFTQTHRTQTAGDCGYPGLLVHEDELWICDYSSHEQGTAIYLSRVPLGEFVR